MQRFNAKDARHLLLINECGIGELLEPVKVVKRRVIDPILAAGGHISGRDAEVLNENAII